MWGGLLNLFRQRDVSDDPERESDFIEPLTFDWDGDTHVAREAAREYSEQTTAEY